ncbi:patatin-like phospholipase family protein [Terricaulis silvestris]|uniref:Patatin n=1 Tax=Terricaulis silvestris TaxID=2686094 RepID=A0A6I6MLY4_9CAUL|nr:patatin-like phospholipase family protein [Terricaulis silvestris]QGZ94318.1 Patatin [Terricaulis silvestris]
MGEHLRERFRRPGPKRILSLDGGGARGLLTLGVLAQLERQLGERSGDPNNFRLAHYFDLIGGTSTGAIIATTLALEWRVREVVDLYFKLLPAIFERPQVPGPLRVLIPAFKNKALTQGLNEHLGDRMLNSDALKTGLAIHAKRIDSGSAWIVVNNADWCYFNAKADSTGVPNSQFYLRDLVQASAAAPTYFADVRIPLARKKNGSVAGYGHFFDGGVSPNNNPAQQLLMTVTEPAFGFNWPTGEGNLLIWSVGTGYVRKRFEKKNRKRRSSAKNIGDFRRLMYSSKVMAALEGYNHDICQQQITLMQALSRPRFPWHVNSEVRMQINTPLLSREPIMTFQRYDARLEIEEEEFRRPEHIETLLGGADMDRKEVEQLRKLDIKDVKLLDILYRTGEALGAAQLIRRETTDEANPVKGSAIAPDWPPQSFDLPSWRRATAQEPQT